MLTAFVDRRTRRVTRPRAPGPLAEEATKMRDDYKPKMVSGACHDKTHMHTHSV